MSQKYPSLPTSDSIWKYTDDGEWNDVTKKWDHGFLPMETTKTDTFKMSSGMEELIKAVVKDTPEKYNLEEGEILEVTDDEFRQRHRKQAEMAYLYLVEQQESSSKRPERRESPRLQWLPLKDPTC